MFIEEPIAGLAAAAVAAALAALLTICVFFKAAFLAAFLAAFFGIEALSPKFNSMGTLFSFVDSDSLDIGAKGKFEGLK